jgi:hypothetical protein
MYPRAAWVMRVAALTKATQAYPHDTTVMYWNGMGQQKSTSGGIGVGGRGQCQECDRTHWFFRAHCRCTSCPRQYA